MNKNANLHEIIYECKIKKQDNLIIKLNYIV